MVRFFASAFIFLFLSSCTIRDAALEQRRLAAVGPLARTAETEPRIRPADDGAATAEERFKDIRVLQGLPAHELYPTMAFFANSLGVTCDYCHTQHFEEDSRQTKKTARQMVLITRAINQTYFQGAPTVTCYTCHDGKPYPSAVPELAEAGWQPKPPRDPRPLPETDAMLARWAARRDPVRTSASGTLTMKGGLGGESRSAFSLRKTGEEVEIRSDLDLPDLFARRIAEFALGAFDPRSRYLSLDAVRWETIDGTDVVTFLGETTDGIYEWVSFDPASGDVVRIKTGESTTIGFVPDEFYFQDRPAPGGPPQTVGWGRGDFLITLTLDSAG